MTLPEILREDFVNEVVGIVLVHLNFFENDPAFAGDVLIIKNRIQNQIAQNIERNRQMFVQYLDAETDALFRGKGVNIAADGIDLTRNFFRRAMLRSLEHHMLDEM